MYSVSYLHAAVFVLSIHLQRKRERERKETQRDRGKREKVTNKNAQVIYSKLFSL